MGFTGQNDGVLAPEGLIVPSGNVRGSVTMSNTAPVGSLIISGAKLCVFTGTKWETCTSA